MATYTDHTDHSINQEGLVGNQATNTINTQPTPPTQPATGISERLIFAVATLLALVVITALVLDGNLKTSFKSEHQEIIVNASGSK